MSITGKVLNKKKQKRCKLNSTLYSHRNVLLFLSIFAKSVILYSNESVKEILDEKNTEQTWLVESWAKAFVLMKLMPKTATNHHGGAV